MTNREICQEVTDRTLAEMKKGVIPWTQPWDGVAGAYNLVSMKPYRGINQLILRHQDAYVTFNQAKQLGGHIKKGAKSERIVFWKMLRSTEAGDSGEPTERLVPILKTYNVFWIGDTVGLQRPTREKLEELQPIQDPEAVIAAYLAADGPKFQNDQYSGSAFYRPGEDKVVVPMLAQYTDVAEYYSTTFHELVHSTGHAKRLNRLAPGGALAAFGSSDYSKEELVAELGSAMLCRRTEVESRSSFRNSAAYLQGWLSALENDPTLIVSAAGKAEKAVSYILGEREQP